MEVLIHEKLILDGPAQQSRVGFVLGTLLLGFGMLFWACGDDEDEPDIPRQDIAYPEDKGSWDPGTPENGCGGYGYGGECPTDEQAIDCSKSPCVFGKCTKAASGITVIASRVRRKTV